LHRAYEQVQLYCGNWPINTTPVEPQANNKLITL